MAYNLSERFPPPPKSFPIFEPAGVYQNVNSTLIHQNNVPFLSKSPRKTETIFPVWTHALYYGDAPPRIPNCSSLLSKVPRFPYESLSKEDIEDILCRCGVDAKCECLSEDEEPDRILSNSQLCQGKIPRTIFKGVPPRSVLGEGISSPCKRDAGYKILPDGSKSRIVKQVKNDPPFYDINVKEHSSFYHGWKWSEWNSQRSSKISDSTPGPAHYTLETYPTYEHQCAENVRAYKRKTSKQLRFIEIVQRRNILQNLPGPADYSPMPPNETYQKSVFSKGQRFQINKYNEIPGPTEYFIKRDFEKDKGPLNICHAKLPTPAAFGTKDVRLKYPSDKGPSPASYNVVTKSNQNRVTNCDLAPFNTSTKRFKVEKDEDDSDSSFSLEDEEIQEKHKTELKHITPSWEFRSKTIRMKPLIRKLDEPSPADLPQPNYKDKRDQLRHACPFSSTAPRFQNWFNWIPVHGSLETPGPGYYDLKKTKCLTAVPHGPISQSRRFIDNAYLTPPPNEYEVNNGVETILMTHNQTLKDRIEHKHKIRWNPPPKFKILTLEEKESLLLNKCIALLDVPDIFLYDKNDYKKHKTPPTTKHRDKTKLLRCFTRPNSIKRYY